jgi:N4-gp56 family major capsid protein
MVTTESTNLSKLVNIYYEKIFLEDFFPNLLFQKFGDAKDIPKGTGSSVHWYRWNKFTRGRLISESAAGISRAISATRVSAQLYMIGDHAIVTSYVDMVAIHSVVEGAVKMFGYSASLTWDFCTAMRLLWHRTALSATLLCSAATGYVGMGVDGTGGNILSAIGTLSAAQFQAPLWGIQWTSSRSHAASALYGGKSAVLFTPSIVRAMVLKLRVKNSMPFEDGYYKCIIHPDIVNQLRGSSAFQDLNKYVESGAEAFREGSLVDGHLVPGGQAVEQAYEGKMEKVKFYSSTVAPMCAVTSSKVSSHGYGRYYFSFFFGKYAYGVTNFDGGIRQFIKTPGPTTTGDPLNLYSTVGYRIIGAQKVLNPSACLWLIHGEPADIG